MARHNTLGTPFLNLGLEPQEEKVLRKYLTDEDVSGKYLMRQLIRKHLKEIKCKTSLT